MSDDRSALSDEDKENPRLGLNEGGGVSFAGKHDMVRMRPYLSMHFYAQVFFAERSKPEPCDPERHELGARRW
jgi:hypothetical protein